MSAGLSPHEAIWVFFEDAGEGLVEDVGEACGDIGVLKIGTGAESGEEWCDVPEFGMQERVDVVFELCVTGAVAVGVQHLPVAESFEDAVFEGRVGHVAGTKKKRRFSVTRKCRLREEGREGVEPSRDGFAIRCLSHLATAPVIREQQQNTRGNLRAVGGLSGLCVF